MISSLATFSKFVSLAGSFLVIGCLLAMAFLLLDEKGKLSSSALKLKAAVSFGSALWATGTLLTIIFTFAEILGGGISEALDFSSLQSFITQITLGQYLLLQLAIALFILLASRGLKTVGYTTLVLGLSLFGLVVPVFQSHSSASGSHSMAIGSLVIHVLALSIWVGGLIALALISPEDRAVAVPRFSTLALWAAIAVVLSGSINAWIRLDFASAWKSAYAYVVLLKIALTVILIAIGYTQRKKIARKAINWVAFIRLTSYELLIMGATLALGAWLSSSQPPARAGENDFDAALAVTGISMPDAPTFKNIFLGYEPDALIIGLLVFAVALYIKGVVVLTKRGDKWPVGRTVAFALGISTIDFATSGGLGLYSHFSFTYHMVAHMVLGMVAPIGIVLGAPITLALRTLPQGRNKTEHGVRGLLIAGLHSKYATFITNPLVALAIFDGSLFGLYLTSAFGSMMQSHQGHLLMDLHFILAGVLFFHVIVGIDPNPKKVPYIVRIVILFVAMSIHAFFSIALMSTTSLIDHGYFASLERPWALDLLADQRAGGAIAWGMGEVPIIIALVATFIQWMRADKNETKRIDRNTERMAALGQPDELAQYNEYLSNLAAREKN